MKDASMSGGTMPPTDQLVVVTGGNGFIGSHVAKHYFNRGYRVRVVDKASISKMDDHHFYTERVIGNLCDRSFCQQVVRGAHTVLHFAAVMGGMGVIHSDNDDIIYQANHEMTQNMLVAASQAGVHTFFYASSACVYPVRLQTEQDNIDVSLREADAYGQYGELPQPQHLYGLEKLNSETLALHYKDRMNIRIGRFHNVYGPRGSWDDGHEKVPAAFMRKALAIKHLGEDHPTFEIWGNGQQRRSFLYIDDAVQAISLLVDSTMSDPVNIGSDQAISIIDLAKLSLQLADLDPSSVRFIFQNKPVGVTSRNSNNELSTQCLSWAPHTPHSKGLSELRDWIDAQIQKEMLSKDVDSRRDYLRCLLSSRVINLHSENLIRFAVLLPVTSRPDPPKCIENLKTFARSLSHTTWRDRNELCATRYEVRIYLAIDHDDEFLLPPPGTAKSDGRAESVLRQYGLSNITTIPSHHPKGHVCALWRDCAHRAFQDRCDYYLLMGDDVEILDEGWMRTIHEKFSDISRELQTPFGFGCVSFTDISFPGMPTFPTIHRTHMEIFQGKVIPEDFINQDGDPYLFQLYRHFGASTTVPVRLLNSIGGTDDARYVKQSLSNWTFEPLELGKETIREWAKGQAPSLQSKLSLDVIVPSYRVDLERLSKILSLKSSSTCTTMFIIIIDDPSSPYIDTLEKDYGQRMDVRIRVNKENLGASASRNRGLTESSAEWVAFLDDDVDPCLEYLIAAERYIREHPDAAGFVGNSFFPVAHNVFTAAVHLAGVTFFWDIANKIAEDVPWGVTANLIVRRNVRDNVKFDLIFPKTGGGEDIDYCRQKRRASLERGGTAFWAAPEAMVTHPWWNGGRRSYRRFYMWSKGDGALIHMYPELSWHDSTPNSAESLLLAGLAVICGVFLGIIKHDWRMSQFGIILAISTVLVHILHDAYRHLIRYRDRAAVIKTTLGPIRWVLAVLEGGLIRMASEMGRLVGVLERHEWGSVGKRFDWFTGGPWGIVEERSGGIERFVCIVGLCALIMGFASD